MRQHLATITAPMLRFVERYRDNRRKRVLVHEILSIQILSATLIGAFAVAALYWGGQWVLQDN